MYEIKKPKLSDISQMRELIAPQVAAGVILERSADLMANMIRSYRLAVASGADFIESENASFIESKKDLQDSIESKIDQNDLKQAQSPVQQSTAIESKTDSIDSIKSQEILGFCALHIHSPNLAEVRSLIVAPNARHKGIATALINDCIKEAKNLGIKEVLTLTYARELFEKIGFVEIEKSAIPSHKIWADCINCKHFPKCDEIALIKHI